MDLSEGGPLGLLAVPALSGQVVDLLGAVGRAGEYHLQQAGEGKE